MPEATDEVLTLREAAAVLKISETTLRRLVAAGEVPTTKVGGSVRCLRSQLLDLVRGRTEPQLATPERTHVAIKFTKFLISLPRDEKVLLLEILGHPRVQPEEAAWLPVVFGNDALLESVLGAVRLPELSA